MAPKWPLCGLLFLATVVNYLDRQPICVLAPVVQKEMGRDNMAHGPFGRPFWGGRWCRR
jgi:ACS family hexuronate transporter-like MFS transporter